MEGGVDKFLDLTGGTSLDETLKLMKDRGHVAIAGNMGALAGKAQTISAPLGIVQNSLTLSGV